jgi:uncharacterized protein YicC (UPF0701 family)
MGVVYAMYDALVSINVPDEKAKAVIDALEREMMDKLATKADLAHLQAITKADIANLQAATKSELANLQAATKADLVNFQAVTRTEFASLREHVSKDLQLIRLEMNHLRTDFSHQLNALQSRLTVRLGTLAGAWTGILFALLKLTD